MEVLAAQTQPGKVVAHVSEERAKVRQEKRLAILGTRALVDQPTLDTLAAECVLTRCLEEKQRIEDGVAYKEKGKRRILKFDRLESGRKKSFTTPSDDKINRARRENMYTYTYVSMV